MTLSKVERLVGKMDSGEPVLGMLNMSYSAELVEILEIPGLRAFGIALTDTAITGST